MKITNNDLIKLYKGLANINKKLPIQINYIIAKNISELEKTALVIDNERQAIISKYAQRNEDGTFVINEGNYSIPYNKIADFSADINELMSIVNDIPLMTISKEIINQASNERYDVMSTDDMVSLSMIIEEV